MDVGLYQLGDSLPPGAPTCAVVLGVVSRRVAPDGSFTYLFLSRLEFEVGKAKVGVLVSTREDAFSAGENVDLTDARRAGEWVGWEV